MSTPTSTTNLKSDPGVTFSPEVEKLITNINSLARDETVDEVLAIARDLLALFGNKETKNAGLLPLRKADYPTYGIKVSYSWVRRLINIALDPKLVTYQQHLPPGRSQIYECAKMTEGRLRKGIEEHVITPQTHRTTLEAWHKRGEPPKEPATPTYYYVVIPPDGSEGAIDDVRQAAFSNDCGFVVLKEVSKHKFDSTNFYRYTLQQTGPIERKRGVPGDSPSQQPSPAQPPRDTEESSPHGSSRRRRNHKRKAATKPKRAKKEPVPIPAELGGRWPFRTNSICLYGFRRACKGVRTAELQKEVEGTGYNWKIMLEALRAGKNPGKKNIHTWELDEEGGILKISNIKVISSEEATASATG